MFFRTNSTGHRKQTKPHRQPIFQAIDIIRDFPFDSDHPLKFALIE
jgi:hypothetical protein